MHNLAGGVSTSQGGELRYAVSTEASLMLTTVISIHLKVAAHFTELSAPLMVRHDLFFPPLLSSSLSSHWQWWRWWTRNKKEGNATFSWLLHTSKLAERWWKGCLWRGKSLAVEGNNVLWSLRQRGTEHTETAAVGYFECKLASRMPNFQYKVTSAVSFLLGLCF